MAPAMEVGTADDQALQGTGVPQDPSTTLARGRLATVLYAILGTALFLYDLMFTGTRAAAEAPVGGGRGPYVLGALLFPAVVVSMVIGVGMIRRRFRNLRWAVRGYFWGSLGLFASFLLRVALETAQRTTGALQ